MNYRFIILVANSRGFIKNRTISVDDRIIWRKMSADFLKFRFILYDSSASPLQFTKWRTYMSVHICIVYWMVVNVRDKDTTAIQFNPHINANIW